MPKIKTLGVISLLLVLISCQSNNSTQEFTSISATIPSSDSTVENPLVATQKPTMNPTAELSATEIETQQPILDIETYPQGSKVEISFTGPLSIGLDPEINPFALQVDVVLQSPDDETINVPAFYDGDGNGGIDGDVWKFRFSPYQTGVWHFTVSSAGGQIDQYEGSFEVVSNTNCRADNDPEIDLNCLGRLEYVGEHYLKFRDGDYWIKAGLDDPENFIGTAFGDWEAKRSQIDFLSEMGINSIYVITNNIDGDRKDTWPWMGETPAQAKTNHDRFDVAKLQEWEDFFSYVQQKGIVLHLVLNDDSAWSGYDQEMYIREMVARFGHHPGIIWNIGEEANEIYSNSEQEDLAAKIKDVDPYNHPVTVHRKSPWPFLGNQKFDLASIQIGDGGSDFSTARLMDYNAIVLEHREQSTLQGHTIPIMIDETPRITEVDQEIRKKFRTQVLYPIFFGGGNFELHYRDAYGQSGSVTIEDLQPLIMDMVRLRRMLESLPFTGMQPCNELLSNPGNICFGDQGKVYAIYFPEGGSESLDFTQQEGEFSATWFDPRTGESDMAEVVEDGQVNILTAPDNNDWVLLLKAG